MRAARRDEGDPCCLQREAQRIERGERVIGAPGKVRVDPGADELALNLGKVGPAEICRAAWRPAHRGDGNRDISTRLANAASALIGSGVNGSGR
jgi:hypothetical protein